MYEVFSKSYTFFNSFYFKFLVGNKFLYEKFSFFLLAYVLYTGFQKSVKPEESASEANLSNRIQRLTTTKEYIAATPLKKRIIDQVEAAVNALKIMERNQTLGKLQAVVSISSDADNNLSNSIVISKAARKNVALSTIYAKPDGKCHVCGISIAYACIKEVQEFMDDRQVHEVDVPVKRAAAGCVDITHR